MIEAVLFDLFETLITERHVGPTRASSLGPVLGLEDARYRAEWRALRPRIVVGERTFVDVLTSISRQLAGRADVAAVQQIGRQRQREKARAYAAIDPDVSTLVDTLVARGLRLGVVSNGFADDVRPWRGCSLAPSFCCTAFSCEEGVAKPDPEIYRRAVRRLRVRPEAAIYIGDGGDDELAGAERAGLRAYRAAWFAPASRRAERRPRLTGCRDVLTLVEERDGIADR